MSAKSNTRVTEAKSPRAARTIAPRSLGSGSAPTTTELAAAHSLSILPPEKNDIALLISILYAQ